MQLTLASAMKMWRIVFVLANLSSVLSSSFVMTVVDIEVEYDKLGDNPDVYLTTPQMIRRHGYGAESHTIETEDGYLLTLHRISRNKNGEKGGQPVFLQHGLLSSSADWVENSKNSLAYLLADAGYDVWLGNARGNTYSTGHVSIPTTSPRYWNFSFHEMGIYDLPASLRHISNMTNKAGEIIYVGHSMGTTMFFVFSSLLQKEAGLVKLMVALAPVAYMTNLRSSIRYLAPFSKNIDWLARHLGVNQFLPNGKILKLLSYECEMNYAKDICENVMFAITGFDSDQFAPDLLPVVLSHDPAGTSTKTIIHYGQEIANRGNFQCFDYGKRGNLRQYGTETPPLYNISNIAVPTYLMYADNDVLVSPIDVERLVSKLSKNTGTYEVPLKTFDHGDFLWGKDAKQLVNEPLLKMLKNYTSWKWN